MLLDEIQRTIENLARRIRALEVKEIPVCEAATPSTHQMTVLFPIEGVLEVKVGALRYYNRFGHSLTLREVFIVANTAPTGADIVVDIHCNGVTIFTGPQPTITDGTNTGSVGPLAWTFASGDYLTMDVDDVGSMVSGSDLVVHALFDWTP